MNFFKSQETSDPTIVIKMSSMRMNETATITSKCFLVTKCSLKVAIKSPLITTIG